MNAKSPRLGSRLLLGALAGLTGTAAMTVAMHRLQKLLPENERYPLPPREITEVVANSARYNASRKDLSLLAHFAFGAGAGALLAAARIHRSAGNGALAGMIVWTASYFGWVPALGILQPAKEHPPRRNALMVGVHLVWGAVTALSLREFTGARDTMLGAGALRDAYASQPALSRPSSSSRMRRDI